MADQPKTDVDKLAGAGQNISPLTLAELQELFDNTPFGDEDRLMELAALMGMTLIEALRDAGARGPAI